MQLQMGKTLALLSCAATLFASSSALAWDQSNWNWVAFSSQGYPTGGIIQNCCGQPPYNYNYVYFLSTTEQQPDFVSISYTFPTAQTVDLDWWYGNDDLLLTKNAQFGYLLDGVKTPFFDSLSDQFTLADLNVSGRYRHIGVLAGQNFGLYVDMSEGNAPNPVGITSPVLAAFTVHILPAVPEPGSWALMLAGLGIAGVLCRKSGRKPKLIAL
ncbi:PEP-CTERM sorting domain-containing protein [Silvimonas soli]|uniref:PEP-CTERM sorting domain-containing protein n=1 Tax=Silvimonas soli TaxID=2980100 RepID=UPI0024B358E2|nr:PEP-CTERM sorting domain-containing protein [Silvimonas soli]